MLLIRVFIFTVSYVANLQIYFLITKSKIFLSNLHVYAFTLAYININIGLYITSKIHQVSFSISNGHFLLNGRFLPKLEENRTVWQWSRQIAAVRLTAVGAG